MSYKKCDLEILHVGFEIELAFHQHKHFHPSGGAHPSSMDIQITDKLNQVCTLLDVNLLDHVIIGEREWFSFREKEMVRNIQHLYAKKVEDVNLTQVAEPQVDYAANNIHRRRSGR